MKKYLISIIGIVSGVTAFSGYFFGGNSWLRIAGLALVAGSIIHVGYLGDKE